MTLNVVPASNFPTVKTAGVFRCDLAADDRLQHRDDVRRRDDRIAREMRHRAVSALTENGQRELVGRGEERSVADADLARVESGVEVQRERAIDVRILERAILDHQPVARVAFFARLEAEDERARYLRAAPAPASRPRRAGC